MFYIWIHVGMVPQREGLEKQYYQQFTRSELDKLDKSAGVCQPSSSQYFLTITSVLTDSFTPSYLFPSQLPSNFLVELGLKGSPTVTETCVVHPELILEYGIPRVMIE